MMERDEEGTTSRIIEFHQRVKLGVERHGGRVVGTAGDSVFGDFDSIIEALEAATEMQEALHVHNAGVVPGGSVHGVEPVVDLRDHLLQRPPGLGQLRRHVVPVSHRLPPAVDGTVAVVQQDLEDQVDRKAIAEERFSTVEDELRSISRWMYENPETAYVEKETAVRLVEFLDENGFDVEHPAYGLETAFAARAGSGGPEVIICAEMDALPGVGHACGHNIIAASALGAAAAVGHMVDDLGFRLTVLGTPAEEHHGGKVDLIEAGAFTDAAASMMVHPSPRNVVDPAMLAIHHLSVEFRGKDAHAAAAPWEGRNALDAFVQLYVNVSTFRQQMRPTDKLHGIITHGGDAPNIIPSLTKSDWYVRAETKERLDELAARFRAFVDAASSASGCEAEIMPNGHEYTEMVSNPRMSELFIANCDSLGRPMGRAADEDPSAAGSTDMGNVSREVPSIHPMIGMETGGAVNHQPEFAAHTITPDGEQAMRDGALAMAWTIIDVAEQELWGKLGSP